MIIPILTNKKVIPYVLGRDLILNKIELYNSNFKKTRRFRKAGVTANLYLNYTGAWDLVTSGTTDSDGIVNLTYDTIYIPNITNCLGHVKLTYNNKEYTSNVVRYNFVEISFILDAGTCSTITGVFDRSAYTLYDASGLLRDPDIIYSRELVS